MKIFEPRIKSLKKIFSQSINIPEFQRGYSWDKSYVTTLFEDILNEMKMARLDSNLQKNKFYEYLHDSLNDRKMFYLGQIVIMKDDIVDGQQRLTSFSLIFKAMHDYLKKYHKVSLKKIDHLLGGLDGIKISSAQQDLDISKILQDEKPWYEFEEEFKQKNQKNILTNLKKRKHYKNYNAILNFLKKEKYSIDAIENIKFFMLEYIKFLIVDLSDEQEALTFFEIMNSKSLPLTPADLIKNSILKTSRNVEKDAEAWQKVVLELGDKMTDLSKFIRYIYIGNIGQVSISKLFDSIKEEKSISILNQMSFYLDSYKKIIGKEKTDSLLIDAQLNFILKLGARESLTPILMEIFKTYRDETKNIEKLFAILVTFSFKYFFIKGFKANAYANYTTEICAKIRKRVENPFKQLWKAYNDELKDSDTSQDITEYKLKWFQSNAEESREAMKFARSLYPLLFAKIHALNYKKYDSAEVKIYGEIYIDNIDIDHLYPQTNAVENGWPVLSDSENIIWNIGNLLPISNSKNRSSKNSNFKIKYNFYNNDNNPSLLFKMLFIDIMEENSDLKIDEDLIWNDEMINLRTNKIFKLVEKYDLFGILKNSN